MSELLTEQRFITNFIAAIFKAIVNQRNKALQAAQQRDPEFRAIVSKLEKARQELHDWAEKKARNDPDAKKDIEYVRNLFASMG